MSSKRSYVIAEMACSHDGQLDLAKTIIDGAGAAGADAIQFQIWSAEAVVVADHPDLAVLRRLELSYAQWTELRDYVRKRWQALEIIACIYEAQSLRFADQLGVEAFKIHAADLRNRPLLEELARTSRRIDLSVGAATIDEIEQALSWIRGASPQKAEADIWLMYGLQRFPTPSDAIHLDFMATLNKRFGLPVGYQDHADGASPAAFWLPAAAIGAGVQIIEKHITHDRAKQGADYQSALDPEPFARFVAMVRELEIARGSAEPRPLSEAEQQYRQYSRKTLVAARDLPAGTTLSRDDLIALRAPSQGLPPDEIDALLAKTTRVALRRHALVLTEHLADA